MRKVFVFYPPPPPKKWRDTLTSSSHARESGTIGDFSRLHSEKKEKKKRAGQAIAICRSNALARSFFYWNPQCSVYICRLLKMCLIPKRGRYIIYEENGV